MKCTRLKHCSRYTHNFRSNDTIDKIFLYILLFANTIAIQWNSHHSNWCNTDDPQVYFIEWTLTLQMIEKETYMQTYVNLQNNLFRLHFQIVLRLRICNICYLYSKRIYIHTAALFNMFIKYVKSNSVCTDVYISIICGAVFFYLLIVYSLFNEID